MLHLQRKIFSPTVIVNAIRPPGAEQLPWHLLRPYSTCLSFGWRGTCWGLHPKTPTFARKPFTARADASTCSNTMLTECSHHLQENVKQARTVAIPFVPRNLQQRMPKFSPSDAAVDLACKRSIVKTCQTRPIAEPRCPFQQAPQRYARPNGSSGIPRRSHESFFQRAIFCEVVKQATSTSPIDFLGRRKQSIHAFLDERLLPPWMGL